MRGLLRAAAEPNGSAKRRWPEQPRRQQLPAASGAEHKCIGLFGLFGSGNFGNDGSLEAMLRLLRREAPDERLLCICEQPDQVRAAFGLEAIPIYYRPAAAAAGRPPSAARRALGRASLWFYALWHLRRMKMLIVPGTGVLDDFAVSPFGWPHDILAWWLLARLTGVKVVLASVGAGPIHHPLSRRLMKAAARAAHYRSYRDTVSRDFMSSIGFDVRGDPICPDIAFSLLAPVSMRESDDEGGPPIIGLGVMAYRGWRGARSGDSTIYRTYLEKITAFVLWLLDSGHQVRLLMGELSDLEAVEDVIARAQASRSRSAMRALQFEPAHTLHDVMRQMAATDIVVATRYHNVVCALKMRKPTISIGYARKNDALLQAMGHADFCQQIEDLDLDLLRAQTIRLIADRRFIERRTDEACARFEARLRAQEATLLGLIN